MLYNLLTIAVVVAVVVWVVGAVVYATWLRHEAHKAARWQDELSRSERFRELSPEVQLNGEEPV